ncbi:hypothetical protein [Collinsella sp. TM09-10AT]|uniref:hypothetical protein n=1 Tax=Collinsella sp. TM09-10AT TaxID=2292343 RepID=UPI001314F67E|nr:hypothetical protein [Collinsella sp. TM09-10AT]
MLKVCAEVDDGSFGVAACPGADALGNLAADAVAVGCGILLSGANELNFNIGIRGEGLVDARYAQSELHECRSAHNGDMACPSSRFPR